MVKFKIASVVSILAAFALTSCMTGPRPIGGGVYTGLKGPNEPLPLNGATVKKGRACSKAILGAVAWGDASIATAKRRGKITEISSVDYERTGVLPIYGVYVETCTIVSGI